MLSTNYFQLGEVRHNVNVNWHHTLAVARIRLRKYISFFANLFVCSLTPSRTFPYCYGWLIVSKWAQKPNNWRVRLFDECYFEGFDRKVCVILWLACVVSKAHCVLVLLLPASGGLPSTATTAAGDCRIFLLNLSSVRTWLPLDKDGKKST